MNIIFNEKQPTIDFQNKDASMDVHLPHEA
jgi:hypothetical protein